MLIKIDENIPMLSDIFCKEYQVENFNGRALNNSDLKDTDVLFVRSTTKVNRELLIDSPVKLVGTATSGTDHIDKEYLNNNEIIFGSAKGCNANSVAEYVIYSILKTNIEYDYSLEGKTIGIIGYGNIGKLVAKYAGYLNLKVLINDQPLFDKGYDFPDNIIHTDYENIFKNSDIITNHVPLSRSGNYKTYDLIYEKLLNFLKDNSIFIHASRGGVVNEKALLKSSNSKKMYLYTDVWENEPEINPELLKKSILSSAHTAGYSKDGKLRGVKMMIDLFNNYYGVNISSEILTKELDQYSPLTKEKFEDKHFVYELLKEKRKFEFDDLNMHTLLELPNLERAKAFDLIRKNYSERRESL